MDRFAPNIAQLWVPPMLLGVTDFCQLVEDFASVWSQSSPLPGRH